MGAIDLELYTKLLRSTPTGAASDSAGSLAEQIAYIVANPASPTWRRTPLKRWGSGSDSTGQISIPVFYLAWWPFEATATSPLSNLSSTTFAGASVASVFDTSDEKYYVRNTTGAQGYFSASGSASVPLGNPYGAGGKTPAFDLDGGRLDMFPPATFDCMVWEWEAALAAAASANNDGVGVSTAAFSGTPFAAANRHIAFYRKSGSGWTLKTSDGTTASEASESSDSSDANKHIFRVEWENKATDEVRLYVDDVLKVTKTSNLPATNTATLPTLIGWCKPSGAATGDLRVYGGVMYWKDAA